MVRQPGPFTSPSRSASSATPSAHLARMSTALNPPPSTERKPMLQPLLLHMSVHGRSRPPTTFPDVSPGPGPFITLAVWRTRRGTSFPREKASRNSLPGEGPTLSLCFGSCVNLHLPIMRSNFITIITNLSRTLSRVYHEFITMFTYRRVPGSGHRGGN